MKVSVKLSGFLQGCLLSLFPLLLKAQPGMPIIPPPVEMVRPPVTPTGAPVYPGRPPGALPVPAATPPVGATGAQTPNPQGNEGKSNSQTPEFSNEERISEILNFWFGWLPDPSYFPDDKLPIWFASTPEIDRQIRNFFAQDVLKAERGEYNSWRETPRGRLALILLLDQVPRHLYRNKPQAFLLDRMARAVAVEGIQKGDDKELFPIERAFFYLPLEHAEDLDSQNLSVEAYRRLLLDSPEGIKLPMRDFLQSAVNHQQQIVRFGRFPHRNAILGRESTPEEIVFLIQRRKN